MQQCQHTELSFCIVLHIEIYHIIYICFRGIVSLNSENCKFGPPSTMIAQVLCLEHGLMGLLASYL